MSLADLTFMDMLWETIIVFAFVIWIWLLITVFGDIFRRRDIGGVMKAFWIIFVIVLPYVGVLIYVLVEHSGMAERTQKHVEAAQAQQADSIKPVTSSASPVDQIAQAKSLLDSGAISQAEFDALKTNALG